MRLVTLRLGDRPMQNGPYLLFARFGDGLDPEQDDFDWSHLDQSRAVRRGYGMFASPNSLVAYFAGRDELDNMTDAPDETEVLEVASVSTEYAMAPFSPGSVDDDGDPVSGMVRLTQRMWGDATVEKPCFSHRLVLAWLWTDTPADEADRLISRLVRSLGRGAKVVWPAREFAGIYVSTSETCQQIADRLAVSFTEDDLYDFGVFRLAGATSPDPISPLSILLTGNR